MASESKAGLESDAAFMDLYSRQIGAFGLETMAKVSCVLCGKGGAFAPRLRPRPL